MEDLNLITYEGETTNVPDTASRCAYFARFVRLLRIDITKGEEPDWRIDKATHGLVRTTILRPDTSDKVGYQPQIRHTLTQNISAGKTTFEESIHYPQDSETQTTRLTVGSDSVEVTHLKGYTTTTNCPALVDSLINVVERKINHRPGNDEDSPFDPAEIASLVLSSDTETN